MPRGRKKAHKLKFNPGSVKSLLAIILIVAGLLSLVSVFTDNGTVLAFVQMYQLKVFGNGAILFPVVIIIFALLLFENLRSKFLNYKIFFGLLLLLVSLCGLFSGLFSDTSGGKLGFELIDILRSAVTIYGGLIILLGLFGISLILIFDISVDQILKFIKDIFSKIKLPDLSFLKKAPKPSFAVSKQESYAAIENEMENEEEEVHEETFEVIPSVSEPIDGSKSGAKVPVSDARISTPTLPYTDKVWEYPSMDLLSDMGVINADRGDVKMRQQIIEKTLESFGIKARVAEINFGPAVTQYALETSSGTKIAKITNLQNDLALALASPTGSVRIEAPIPGKSLIGIEVPNVTTAVVSFKSMITSDILKGAKSKLTIALGHNVSGLPCVADISKMPHMLIAGSTGSGKSVFLHALLFSLLYRCSPAECKLILVDPKRVELVNYNDIPHLLIPVITDADKAPNAFKWAVAEMERRYKLFENAKVRNINAYNELSGFQALPFIVIVVDELAELMALQPGEMEKAICRLAQLSRATGIHLVLATQRPSVDVLTGLIKANIPTRIAFNVTSQVDSRVIIDSAGAEKLLGKGDMLYVPPESSKPVRIQGVYVTDKELNNLVAFLKNSGVTPEYKDEVMKPVAVREATMDSSDELFDEAVRIVALSDRASASLLQRKLSIGYARAARLLDELEAKGIVGGADGSKPRDVLIRNPESILNNPASEES